MANPAHYTVRGITVWLICALFFMYEFFLRTVLGTLQAPLMLDLKLTPITFALLSATSYQIAYGCMQMPVGIITDRFGLKKTLLFAVIFCMFANAGFALTHSFYSAATFRVLMGIGSSFGFVCLLMSIHEWIPGKRIALFIGISQFIGTLGPMIAAGPLDAISASNGIDWRTIFFGLAIIGFIIAFLVFCLVDKNRTSTGKYIILTRPERTINNVKKLLRNPQIWYIALYSGSVYFSIEFLSENDGKLYLMSQGVESHTASYMITLAWLGYAISCPLIGYISDRTSRRKPIMMTCAMVSMLSLIGIIYLPLNMSEITICFILLGFGASGQSIGFVIMAEQCKENYLAVGLGFNNSLIMLFAASSAPIAGAVMPHLAPGQHYIPSDYQHAFTVLPIFVLVSITLAWFFIEETYAKSARETTKLTLDADTL